jgi:lysozyme family protein
MSIQSIIDGVIGREGRYSNNPADPGGETMWGITASVARASGYMGPMVDMPRATAEAIYTRSYITQPGFDKVAALSTRIAEKLVDTGVNCGAALPGPWLQRCLNVFNRQGKDYPDIGVDGAIGPATLGALRAFLDKRGAAGETVLLRALSCLQGARYIDLGEKNQRLEEFEFGWFANRVEL